MAETCLVKATPTCLRPARDDLVILLTCVQPGQDSGACHLPTIETSILRNLHPSPSLPFVPLNFFSIPLTGPFSPVPPHAVLSGPTSGVTMTAVLDSHYLAFTALLSVGYQLVFFAITATFRFDKLTDFAGGTGFILNALVTMVVSGGYHPRQVVLSSLQMAWGLRLALFLLFRILKWGEDKRFDGTRDSLPKLVVFWSLQALWVWTVSLPVTLINADARGLAGSIGLGAADYVGWALFATGLALEAVADQQKLTFKSAPDAKAWCDVGVWRWSRHPNYFGEWLVWWGVFISAARQLRGGEYAAVVSPLFIMALLLGLSGMPIQEKGWNKKYGRMPGFDEWKRTTSPVVPLPPAVYGALPEVVKTVFLFEWPIYAAGLHDGAGGSDDADGREKTQVSGGGEGQDAPGGYGAADQSV